MLTGPIYMLQIYDRVLSSQSMQTLLGLTVIIIFLYTCGGLLDFFRSRAMAQAGAILQTSLDKVVFVASMQSQSSKGNSAIRDLESIQRFMTSPAYLALFDIVFTPIFLIGIMIFHPWLGYLAVAGGTTLILIAILRSIFYKKFRKFSHIRSANFQSMVRPYSLRLGGLEVTRDDRCCV